MTDSIDNNILDNVDKYQTVYDWIILSDCDQVSIVAPGTVPDYYNKLYPSYGITVRYYDYDPKFTDVDNFTICDVVFDRPTLTGLIVSCNAQKMYPLGRLYQGEFIIIGTDANHNGDCNPVTSCQQLIEQNNISTVYKQARATHSGHERFTYTTYIVWGTND